MSREFEAFCIEHGIQRQHTVRNHPQQNGVAERSNRTMDDGIVSMLYESGMTTAFWERHWLLLFTPATDCSPQHSQTALHIRLSLAPSQISLYFVFGAVLLMCSSRGTSNHLGALELWEKCVFMGYPQSYKGWKFYNPVTKKVVISERADFNEGYFMLQRQSVPHLPPPCPDTLLEP